jgi:hypothetical protein
MVPHLVAVANKQMSLAYGRLSDIYQIIVNHQAVEAALQADWFHQIKSLLFVTNNYYVDMLFKYQPPQRYNNKRTNSFLLCFTRSVRPLSFRCEDISPLVQVLYTRDYT